MRDRRHIPTTLLLGTGGVMLIYILVNIAYIQALGFKNTQGFNPAGPIAVRALGQMGEWASKIISVLVMISALGAVNGLLFAGSRVSAALGKEHSVFAILGRINTRVGSAVYALLALMLISMSMVLIVGTETGRNQVDKVIGALSIGPIPWNDYHGGFSTLFAGGAPVFWAFFLLTGISIFILRIEDADVERPFKIPGYPVTPLIFIGMCLFGLYSAVTYAGLLSLIGVVPLLIGIPLYLISRYTPTQESQPLRRHGDAPTSEMNQVMPHSRAIQPGPSPAIQEKQS
jgi:amino acid transporter